MSNKVANTFNEGLNMDASDFVLANTQLRYGLNIRMINLEGSNYVVTNLKGTEEKFQLTSGFVPVATKEFNLVLYIISYNATTTEFEIGSYPSPAYEAPGVGSIWQYRPFNNFNAGPFRTVLYDLTEKPLIQELNIQPDYDQSVNCCFTIAGKKPKLINSKFDYRIQSDNLTIIPTRSGLATSNEYTSASLVDETTLILATDKLLKIAFAGLSSGGKIKPGNYSYVFKYMSEDLNQTDVVGQSSICQVAFGSSENERRGGDETQQTSYRISLNLTNIDTNFKFLKVFVLYSSGQDTLSQQYLEFITPVQINGETLTFTHDGYEQLVEVAQSDVNVDYSVIESAGCSTQVGGYYFMADITQNQISYAPFIDAAADLFPILATRDLTGTGGLAGYSDPNNVYNYMGGMGGESYPYGIVFILPGNVLTPVFPTKGMDFLNNTVVGNGSEHVIDPVDGIYYARDNGIVRYPDVHKMPFLSGTTIKSRYIRFNMSTIPAEVKNTSVGFFFVRGERRSDLLAQGILIPTMKVPAIDGGSAILSPTFEYGSYTNTLKANIDNTSFFKHLPIVDSLLEAYVFEVRGDQETTGDPDDYGATVIDRFGQMADGFLPIYMADMKGIEATAIDPWVSKTGETALRHWALYTGDALVDEPTMVAKMNNKKSSGILQIAKLQCKVGGKINNVASLRTYFFVEQFNNNVGLHYNFDSYTMYGSPTMKTLENISFVQAGSFSSAEAFTSKIQTSYAFGYKPSSGGIVLTPDDLYYWYFISQNYNSYFGVEVKLGENLVDATKGLTNPIGSLGFPATSRIGASLIAPNNTFETFGQQYENMDTVVPTGFLVNIYDQLIRSTPNQLYKSIDNITYRQVTPRYSWDEATGFIDVYGGDCYVAKVNRKLNQSPFTDPFDLPDPYNPDTKYEGLSNIDAGIMVSWYQESANNLNLRQPGIADLSEPGERSFFPYQTGGDFIRYRKSRLQETIKYSLGYSQTFGPKEYFKISSLTPYIKSNFFVRVIHSAKHVPNAFRNGYRSFLPSASRDYDASMGKITALYNHRGSLLVIFEHGVGITTIEQRVETAEDISGGVFIQPSEVLPPTLQYWSREIGCQHPSSIVQTPSGIYFIDVSKNVIVQIRDGLIGISDQGFASFMKINGINNPRSGYDFQMKEVIFTTDQWTLCFKEGLEKFTSFYSYKGDFYSRRGNDFYSYKGRQAHVHNEPTFSIYGEDQFAIVEFTINQNLDMTKVLDYVNIISNDIRPSKIECYTYNEETQKKEAIDLDAVHQYSVVNSGIDVVTEEDTIEYRDKKFAIQIPEETKYKATLDDDEWAIDGRLRNKYFIVRITYQTDKLLQLASIISTFRFSKS